MTKDHKLVGGEPFGLPIYALLTQMHAKKRRSFDGTFYYINLSKRVLRVPHSYRADRCTIVDNYYSVPDMYRMIETAVADLGEDQIMAPLKQEMTVLRDKVDAMKKKFDNQKSYPHSDLSDQLNPITEKIAKKYNLEDGTFTAPSSTRIRWRPPDKLTGDLTPTLDFTFRCKTDTFKELINNNAEFSPNIAWDFKIEKNDNHETATPMEVVALSFPTHGEYFKLKEQFQNMAIETYNQYKTVHKDYNKKVQEFETTLLDIQAEYKRVYDTYCAEAVKEILLVQDFDAII